MKPLRSVAFLLGTLLFFSCSKRETNATGDTSLTGTWKLVEVLADPGDGSGTWQPVTGAAQTFLTFTAAGRLYGNAFPQARSYERLNDSTIRFIYADGTFINYTCMLSGTKLVLSGGGCIEACGATFMKQQTQLPLP